MDELKAKIERLRVRYLHDPTMPPVDVLALCETLREQVEAQWHAIEHLNAKVVQLEKTAPGYQERS